MFNKQNFCHIASNNRNEVKVGVFVYKTTDNLQTVLTSGYFNEKIVDINLHDLIIHEWHDPADRTKVERNVLCVTERTLDNVGTTVIQSKWEKTIDEIVAGLDDKYVKKTGDTMTGALTLSNGTSSKDIIIEHGDYKTIKIRNADNTVSFTLDLESPGYITPAINKHSILGSNLTNLTFGHAYIQHVHAIDLRNENNDVLQLPNEAATLATKAQVDLAANSGRMITDQGVWYAKMEAAGTIPAEAEVEGRNYADFTQVDVDNNPIIVIYTYTSGAWTQTETITPPAAYDGYVPVTSKIWDIPEQAGQQGGRILWNHQSKEFTPYPVIISFEDAHLTGDSTVVMPLTPSGSSIVNVDYLSTHTGSGKNVGDVFFTMRTDGELSGAVECNGDTYNTEDFIGAGSISALLENGKIPYITLAQYATLLSTNGSVGVFGWDGVGTTAFRVPSLNDIFVETGTSAQIGDYIAPAVPEITGSLTKVSASRLGGITATGAFTATYVGQSSASGNDVKHNVYDIGFSAHNSNNTYGIGNTVQPNTVRYRAMVQLATGATDQALETCTQVLADVAGLKDASNITSTGKDTIIGWSVPDYANEIEISAEATYTCPDNGWLCIYTNVGGSGQYKTSKIANYPIARPFAYGCANTSSTANTLMYPVEKNEVLTRIYWAGNVSSYFVPCKK